MTVAAILVSGTTALAGVAVFLSGNPADVRPRLHGPVLDLAGSSAEPGALQAMIDAVRGCSHCAAKLDVVVIRASGDDALNAVFMALDGVDSAQTFVITDRDASSRDDVIRAVRDAEIVWFAGGDQCNYIRWVKDTPVQRSVEQVFERGGGVGGNSAGLAIQGDITYDACPDVSANSKDVLADPFHRDVSLSSQLFRWPALRGMITDTHFHERDRFGRLVVFLARSYAGKPLYGIGVDEETAIVIGPDRKGRVFGPGSAYLLRVDHPAAVLERGKPLTYRDLKVWKFKAGDTIDFVHRPERGYRSLDIAGGKLSADPY